MSKLSFATGMAVGYVLGARAGRERYEAIMRSAERVRGNPQVQQTASRITHQASDLASQASQRVTERVPFGSHRPEPSAGYGAPNGRNTTT